MSTTAEPKRTDLETICRAIAEGKKVDPVVAKRVQEESDAIRRKFDREISIEMLRSVRDHE